MADLQDRKPHAWQRDEVALRLLEDGRRKHSGTGSEIIDTGHAVPSLGAATGQIKCTSSPSRSFGSNQVDLGGMIAPASAIAISSPMSTG